MVADGDQICVEPGDLGRRGGAALQHAQHVGGMAKASVGGDGLQALPATGHGGGEHRRRRDQPQGGVQVVAVR